MEVRYEVEGDLGRLVLAGGEGNALDRPDFARLEELEAFFARPELRAVVVQGRGRTFCTGASPGALEALGRSPDELAARLDGARRLLEAIRYAPVPVVASIRGGCLGGGLELALACHFRVASSAALLGFPETSLGLLPGLGGALLAAEAVGRARAMDLVLSARLVTGEEALAIGLVDRVVPTGELEGASRALARSLVGDRPAHLVRAAMECVHAASRLPMAEALGRQTALFLELARRASGAGP